MQFIGIDLHTNKFTCCYRDENSGQDGKKETVTFELSPYGIKEFYRTLTKETYVLIEATITTFCFTRLIQPFVKQVIVANTYELKQISLARKNTDKSDFSPQMPTSYAVFLKCRYFPGNKPYRR